MTEFDQNRAPRSIDSPARATTIIELCVTDDERIEYQKAAERSGLSLSAWICDRLHEALKREAKEA